MSARHPLPLYEEILLLALDDDPLLSEALQLIVVARKPKSA